MGRIGPDMLLERACPGPVCGVDEAGRGPWAGPVCAAAVILNPRPQIRGLDDLLQPTEAIVEAQALAAEAYGADFSLNILHATGLAMKRAIEAMAMAPAFALVDGNYAFPLPCPVKTVVGGDGISASIAAASILAKTARDRLMALLDESYPGYGFASHKQRRPPWRHRCSWAEGFWPEHYD